MKLLALALFALLRGVVADDGDVIYTPDDAATSSETLPTTLSATPSTGSSCPKHCMPWPTVWNDSFTNYYAPPPTAGGGKDKSLDLSWIDDMLHDDVDFGSPGGDVAVGGADRYSADDDSFDESDYAQLAKAENRTYCVVSPAGGDGDDAAAIAAALNGKCRSKSFVFLPGPTYKMRSNITTLGLDDVSIIQIGKMVWTPDVDYWLSVSMPVGFQNQSTVWYFGGNNILWEGFGLATLDGNGQVWYDWARSRGNLARRPMNINLRQLTNSTIRGLRFVQSQMWTMAITHSRNVVLSDIYVNSTSTSEWSTLNTDGCDTINSHNITFDRWFVVNGDDGIALKGNSTSITVRDSVFHDGQGLAIGSLAQYQGRHDIVDQFQAVNITMRNTAHVVYLKTWGGVSRGYPPNGGGGGLGRASNMSVRGVRFERLRQPPFFSWQCENYEGYEGKDCNSSLFRFSGLSIGDVQGTVENNVNYTGSFQCSAAAGGCDGFDVRDVNVTRRDGQVLDAWHCENVHAHSGFECGK